MQEESESEEELDGLNLEGDDGAFPDSLTLILN